MTARKKPTSKLAGPSSVSEPDDSEAPAPEGKKVYIGHPDTPVLMSMLKPMMVPTHFERTPGTAIPLAPGDLVEVPASIAERWNRNELAVPTSPSDEG